MDLVSIGLSAALSAVLFIVLEFTIILPLFRKIVTNAVNNMVQGQLIPSVSNFVDTKVTDLTEVLTKSLFNKFRGFFGGTMKGRKNVTSLLERLSNGEDLEDIEDDFEPSTIDKLYDMFETVRPFLPDPATRRKKIAAAEQQTIDGIRES